VKSVNCMLLIVIYRLIVVTMYNVQCTTVRTILHNIQCLGTVSTKFLKNYDKRTIIVITL